MHRIKNQGHLLRKSLLSLGLTTLGIVTLTAVGSAEPTQSSASAPRTVASILAEPTDGTSVTLQGHILQRGDDDEEYIFTDETGEISVEIYAEDFSTTPDRLLEISGEVDLESEDPTQHEAHPEAVEIDVYQIQVVTPAMPSN
jgi:uncharacterized protein (TIGR00156 family)